MSLIMKMDPAGPALNRLARRAYRALAPVQAQMVWLCEWTAHLESLPVA